MCGDKCVCLVYGVVYPEDTFSPETIDLLTVTDNRCQFLKSFAVEERSRRDSMENGVLECRFPSVYRVRGVYMYIYSNF